MRGPTTSPAASRSQAGDTGALLEAVLEPGDRVCLEGNNQKQADFLAQRAGCGRPGSGSTTCTWCSRCWRCPSISTCSSAASRSRLDFSLLRARRARGSPSWWRRAASRSARSTPTSSCSRRYFVDLTPQRGADRRAGGRRRRAISTPAPTPRTRRPSSRPPPSSGGIVIAQVNELRRHAAARRHPGRLGRLRRRRRRGPTTSSRCSRATRRRSPRSRC